MEIEESTQKNKKDFSLQLLLNAKSFHDLSGKKQSFIEELLESMTPRIRELIIEYEFDQEINSK